MVYEDNLQNLWVGGYGAGLGLMDKNQGTFSTYKNIPGVASSIPNNDVRAILQDDQGNLWLTTHGKGVAKFNTESKTFMNFSEQSENPNRRLASDWTWPLAIDGNTLWVGSANGISLINVKTDTVIRHFHNIKGDTNSLSNNAVQCLQINNGGQIWVGTSKGLNPFA